MKKSYFSDSKPGKLVRTIENGWAFVPNPLPPTIEWDDQLASLLSRADRMLGRLDGVGSQLPNPHLLIAPFIRREAVLSSRIEGTQTLLPDLLLFDVSPEVENKVPDVREVANYVDALDYGMNRITQLPLSLRLLKEVHEKLMTGVRGKNKAPGQFRKIQNLIGPPGCTKPLDATYVPPPVPEMTHSLHDFEKYLHINHDLPPLVNLALIHYQFEAIHPFLDGNGRVGRLLITLLLCEKNLLSQPLLYLSAYLVDHKEEYYDHLLHVSLHGRWKGWVIFFLEGIVQQATDAVTRSKKLLGLREEYRQRIQKPRSSTRVLELIDWLFQTPYINSTIVHRVLGVSHTSARNLIQKLASVNILHEVTGHKRNRIYLAEEILRAVE